MTHYLRALAARLRGVFGDRRAERELDDEIETHLRLLTEPYVRQGMTEAEAAWAARRQFGNVTLLQEASREMRGIRLIDTLVQDLRYGVRMLVKNPGFTLVVTLTLALGSGANTAIFSLADALLWRGLPAANHDRLFTVMRGEGIGLSYPNYVDYRDRNQVLEVFSRQGITLSIPDLDDQDYIHDKYMSELVNGVFRDETRQQLLAIVDRLIEREGIQGLILGGTELPLILRNVSDRRVPFLDTTRIHVERAVAQMFSEGAA